MNTSRNPIAGPLLVGLAMFMPAAGRAGSAPQTRSGIETCCAALSARYHETVLFDPDLRAGGEPGTVDTSGGLARALDSLASHLAGAEWRRIQLPANSRVAPGRLAAVVREMERAPAATLTVEDVIKARSLTVEIGAHPGRTAERVEVPEGSSRGVYLIFKPSGKSDGLTADERFTADQQALAELLEASPEHRSAAVESGMRWWMGLDATVQRPLMGRMLEAGTHAWDSSEPAERQAMITGFVHSVQSVAPPASGVPGEATARPNRSIVNFREELARLLETIQRHTGSPMRLESGFFLAQRPLPPTGSTTAVGLLTELMTPLKELGWRRIVVRELRQTEPVRLERLVPLIRVLDQFEPLSIEIENLRSHRVSRYRSRNHTEDRAALEEKASGYLIFARGAVGISSLDPFERLLVLLDRQERAIVGADVSALSQMMEQGVQRFRDQDSAGRDREMSLPVMAGLMAVWMPRQAKEQGGK